MYDDENLDVRVPVSKDSFSITRDDDKCILCGSCRSTCKYSQGVYGYYDIQREEVCIDCGQCSNVCPTSAITEVMDYVKVKKLLKNKDKIVIFQTAPAIRVSLGEEFGLEKGSFVQGKLVSLLKKLGASYVFDTAFGADLTIMEEANELVYRLQNDGVLPMFTSCCPAWVKFAETFYPKYIPNLSSCKSPILMEGAIIKSYFALKTGIDPLDIISVAVTPCTAKKAEIKRDEMIGASKYTGKDTRDIDYIITTRELARLAREENIDFNSLEDCEYDSILGEASGAGVIFGTTGGVMEASIRTAHFYITGKPLEKIDFVEVRGLDGIKEANVKIGDYELSLAVVTGTANAHKFFELLESSNKHYDFVEFMACIGGCIAGGGQPKFESEYDNSTLKSRSNGLYNIDSNLKKRNSYENGEIKALYDTFLKEAGSEVAETLLHTTYKSRCTLLKEEACK